LYGGRKGTAGQRYAQFDFWAEAERNKPYAERSFHDVGDEDMLALIYTSGTTSRPKGILVRFDRIIRNGLMFAGLFKIPRGARFLGTFSQGYLGGLYNTLLFQFLAEGSVALDAGFTHDVAVRFWDTVEKFNVTALWPAPSMLAMILAIDRGQKERRMPLDISSMFLPEPHHLGLLSKPHLKNGTAFSSARIMHFLRLSLSPRILRTRSRIKGSVRWFRDAMFPFLVKMMWSVHRECREK